MSKCRPRSCISRDELVEEALRYLFADRGGVIDRDKRRPPRGGLDDAPRR